MSIAFFAGNWYRISNPVFFRPTNGGVSSFFSEIEAVSKRHSPVLVVLAYDIVHSQTHTPLGIPCGAAFCAEKMDLPPESLARKDGFPAYCFFGIEAAVGIRSYKQMFREVKEALREGYTYQVNLTFPISMRYNGDLVAAFLDLAEAQRGKWHAFVSWDDWRILSFSPELFFELDMGRLVMRPMKGTWPKGVDIALTDKDRAENVMIVDMCRNDMGRACVPSSIEAELFIKEDYPTVTQLISEIKGTVAQGVGISDILRALFPCASITGAPKEKTIEIIDTVEAQRRGIYIGAIGIIEDGTAKFNVAIRTIEARQGRAVLGVGGGIVWDSDCLKEFGEAFLKARFFLEKALGFSIIETMRWENGRCRLLRYHIERLIGSARFFGFRFNRKRLEIMIKRCSGETKEGAYRVRFLLAPSGRIEYKIGRLVDDKKRFKACVSEEVIDPDIVWHYHKTTNRDQYDRALRQAQGLGCDEAIMLNKNGYVSQGAITNVFIKEADGRYATPLTEDGCLNGVLRRSMLDAGRAYERHILPSELFTGDLWLGNAVRGLVKAEL